MLLTETILSFKKGTLELWCPKIIIRQQASDNPIEYKGSGLIRQNQENRLEFVLLESPSPSYGEKIKCLLRSAGNVGKLIPPDEYYSLEADDLSGRNWIAERLRISHSVGSAGSISSGEIYVLEHTDLSESRDFNLHLEIFSDVKLPFNEATKTVPPAEKEFIFCTRNMARSTVRQLELIILREKGILTIEAASETVEAPDNIETRIIEALQYISSQTLSWQFLQKTANGKSITCFRSPDKGQHSTNLSLPIDYEHSYQTEKWVWMLFEKYLEHIYDFKGKNRFQMHPLSAWLNFIRNNSGGSIFTRGLGLGIAVEGILKSEYPDTGLHDKNYNDAVKEIIAYTDSFSGCKKIKQKALGALRSLQEIRAIDILSCLQSEGVIRTEDISAWKEVRNRGAHARPPENEDLQKWIDSCYKTEVLINHLIFHAIGYKGKFTDYGDRNKEFPLVHYPFTNTTSK